MSLPSLFQGMSEVRGALTADRQGHVQETTPEGSPTEQDAAVVAATLGLLETAGSSLGFGRLEQLQIRGASRATLAAVGADAFLLAEVDPKRRSPDAERAVASWGQPAGAARPDLVRRLTPARPVAWIADPSGALPDVPPRTITDLPAVGAPPPAPAQAGTDPWAALRRSLVRGHLTEASARQQAIAQAPPAVHARTGSEPLEEGELSDVMQRLLEGIGSVMSGDTVGGTRGLRELTTEAQKNLSVRWLALYWCARAALGGSGLETARLQVKEALALSRQLDVEARAVSQLVAAELLARAGENDRALTWLAESRSRFDRDGNQWGQGQTWLVEARIWATLGNAEGCDAAARRAREADPSWDGPPIFLAGRALAAGDLDVAESFLDGVTSPAADRVRRLLAAVRGKVVGQADASEFLRLHHAPPSAPTMRALERIANAAPRFFQAREALAWMLLKLGKYASAREIFAWLEQQPLDADDRAVVQLGLSSVAAAAKANPAGEAPAGAPVAGAGDLPKLTDSMFLPPAARNGAPGVGSADAVFSGRLSVFSLPDLVEFLRSARRTGLLVCSSPAGMGTMRFDQGSVTGASSPATPGVGELLLAAGKVTPEALQEAIPPGTPPEAVGDTLVQRGLVDSAAVQEALRKQIEATLRELVRWSDGEFAFNKEEAGPASGATAVHIDAQELLLNLFKEMDEVSRDSTPSTPA